MAADKTRDALSWKERLQIAVDAAQGQLAELLLIKLNFYFGSYIVTKMCQTYTCRPRVLASWLQTTYNSQRCEDSEHFSE